MDESPQAWPPDFDDNGYINTTDVLSFRSVFGIYDARHDLNSNGYVDTNDILSLKPVFLSSCSP